MHLRPHSRSGRCARGTLPARPRPAAGRARGRGPGSAVTNVEMTDGVRSRRSAARFVDFLRRAEHQVIEADRVDAELLGDVDHAIERVERLVRDRGVDADAQRRVPAACGRLQPAQAGRRSLERALHAARLVVQLAGAVDRDADVLQESRAPPAPPAPRRAPR